MNPLPPNIQAQLNERCPCLSKPLAECDCRSTDDRQSIASNLAMAQPFLQAAYEVASKVQLGESRHDLYMSICDTYSACNEALERINDAPDEP